MRADDDTGPLRVAKINKFCYKNNTDGALRGGMGSHYALPGDDQTIYFIGSMRRK
jgi:hypothetical protein